MRGGFEGGQYDEKKGVRKKGIYSISGCRNKRVNKRPKRKCNDLLEIVWH